MVSAGGKCVVTAVSTKEKSENAPVLYDLTMLQREANRVLGYTAQQTLDYLRIPLRETPMHLPAHGQPLSHGRHGGGA